MSSADYAYIDALSMYLVQQPAGYDVLVTENMYGGHYLGFGPLVWSAAWGWPLRGTLARTRLCSNLRTVRLQTSLGRARPIQWR